MNTRHYQPQGQHGKAIEHSMDTVTGHTLDVGLTLDGDGRHALVRLCDVTTLPGRAISLTPDEAVVLGRWLLEQAHEAALSDMDRGIDDE